MQHNYNNNNLSVPETNREIGIYIANMQEDITELKGKFNTLEGEIKGRRFKRADLILGSLILPVLCGILLILLTQGFSSVE